MYDTLKAALKLIEIEVEAASRIETTPTAKTSSYKGVHNTLIALEKGSLALRIGTSQLLVLQQGEVGFLPKARPTEIMYQVSHPTTKPQRINQPGFASQPQVAYKLIRFTAGVFGLIDIFDFWRIGVFSVKPPSIFTKLTNELFGFLTPANFDSQFILRGYAHLLVAYLLRHIVAHKLFESTQQPYLEGLTNDKTLLLLKHIACNLSKKLSNSLLGMALSLSKDYLSQQFKKTLGRKLQTSLKVMRLQKAAIRLLSTESSLFIHEISQQVGYSDHSYFCRSFKKYWGLTAGEMYAKRQLKGLDRGL